jgi:ribonucleoside-diphosphate reductase alpha chain
MSEPPRTHLPDTRQSITCRIAHTGDLDVYVILGFFENNGPGEIFIKIGKEGSTLQGLMDIIAIQSSLMLQYGIPWERIARKLRYTNFEPLNKEGHSVAHAIVEAVDKLIVQKGQAGDNK